MLCVLIVDDISAVVNVMLSLIIGTRAGEIMYSGCVCFRGELGFLNCDDISMYVVNKQFELLEFDFDSVYVELQYDKIFLTFTAGSVIGF